MSLFLSVLLLIMANRPFYVDAEMSWYDPALGGVNCDASCDLLGNGMRVDEWYNRALACPVQFERGTIFRISGSRWGLADGDWVCWDSGGAVVIRPDGSIVLDLLIKEPIWKETLRVLVIPPDCVDDACPIYDNPGNSAKVPRPR